MREPTGSGPSGPRAFLVAIPILIVGWFAYAPALNASFSLDDVSNLSGLEGADNADAALRFVFSGTAGPTGRPLALASFLPQAGSWPDDPGAFLAVNVLLHLLNAALVGWFAWRLCLATGRQDRGRAVALTVAALWLFMPLLASTSLMVVQRMTSLSGTFVLAGLVGYLYARAQLDRRPKRALAGMTAALVIGTSLAILAKEIGALLPLYVLVLEATVLPRPRTLAGKAWRGWQATMLVAPALLILVFVLMQIPYAEAIVQKRGFTAWERLLTESRVLWEYLFKAFLPASGGYTPYHDGYPVARRLFEPLTLLAVTGWLAAAAFVILRRRSNPVLSLAVAWFLAGHLLESTVIPLDLYFEHRNYLPVIGPAFALAYSVFGITGRYRVPAVTALLVYIAAQAAMLFSLTSLWGNPSLSAAYWHERYPESVRALTVHATRQLAERGPDAMLSTLRDFVAARPEHAYLLIQELNLSCIIAPGARHRPQVRQLREQLQEVAFTYSAGNMLAELLATVTRQRCRDVGIEEVRVLAEALAGNERYRSDAGYRQYHQQLLARIAQQQGDVEQTLVHLREAIRLKPATDLNTMVVSTLAGAGRFSEAEAFIDAAGDRAPLHPLRRVVWMNDLDDLRAYLQALRAQRGK